MYLTHATLTVQAMKRSEQQQCIDAFNKRVGKPAPTPVQFPRPPAQQAQAPVGKSWGPIKSLRPRPSATYPCPKPLTAPASCHAFILLKFAHVLLVT